MPDANIQSREFRGKPRCGRSPTRRGNTMVLVVGILTLLVLVATAYISRTQAERTTAVSTRKSAQFAVDGSRIGRDLAGMIGDHLFVRPVDVDADADLFTGSPGTLAANSNIPRLPPESLPYLLNAPAPGDFPFRYARDARRLDTDSNIVPDHDLSYAFAPFQTVPWTNWPDPIPPAVNTFNTLWPPIPGLGGNVNILDEHNPRGNPGFGDCRWLADLEPLRFLVDPSGAVGDEYYVFTHWRHMTNIAHPNNGWRLVANLADVGSSIVPFHHIPFEQWRTIAPVSIEPLSGQSVYVQNAFFTAWQAWLGLGNFPAPELGYQIAYNSPPMIPPNFYRLTNLNGNSVILQAGERPGDEFVPGTARWDVSRVLADADGDGFTDSFWFLAPDVLEGGVRQVVAVRIIDNGGMLNANVATRFLRDDIGAGFPREQTIGHTPADLAMVGEAVTITAPAQVPGTWNVGFFDNWANRAAVTGWIVQYGGNPVQAAGLWQRHLDETGLRTFNITQQERLLYWLRAGLNPLSPPAASGLTPFTLADELELRLFAGNNNPWNLSRFELSSQLAENLEPTFLHGLRGNEESSEYQEQLTNRQLALESRHRLTLYNGARNDLMPPWLRWRWEFPAEIIAAAQNIPQDDDANGRIDVYDRFLDQSERKLDLRENRFGIAPAAGYRTFEERLAPTLLLAMTHEGRVDHAAETLSFETYFDTETLANVPPPPATPPPSPEREKARRLAAALAANIREWRDDDHDAWLYDGVPLAGVRGAEPLPEINLPPVEFPPLPILNFDGVTGIPRDVSETVPADRTIRQLGMERQPFLVEAFIGHIYAALDVPAPGDPDFVNFSSNGLPFDNSGQNLFADREDERGTIVVVQLANPFNESIRLGGFGAPGNANYEPAYELSIFGQTFNLSQLAQSGLNDALQPDTDAAGRPQTMILYAVKDTIGGNSSITGAWQDFLDLQGADHDPDTVIHNITSLSGAWDTDDRTTYDDQDSAGAIELRRRYPHPTQPGVFISVVVDRIDPPGNADRSFGDAVNDMKNDRPGAIVAIPGGPGIVYGDPDPPGLILIDAAQNPQFGDKDFWVQWVRVTRAWGVDGDGDAAYERNERSPRYVFGHRTVVQPRALAPPSVDESYLAGGNLYTSGDSPDLWFGRDYFRSVNGSVLPTARKPTFFDMNNGDTTFYPDKGWYAQAIGTVMNGVDLPTYDASQSPPASLLGLRFPMQMLHKDGDFEQLGELLHVWLYGHELEFDTSIPPPSVQYPPYERTTVTFSEKMAELELDLNGSDKRHVNRLSMPTDHQATDGRNRILAAAADPLQLDDPAHGLPALPAAVRVLDAFICDGPGSSGSSLSLAHNFTGRATPGLPNINTAPVEVLRAVPHWYKAVHEINTASANPRVGVPEAIAQYRDRVDANQPPFSGGNPQLPGPWNGADYQSRIALVDDGPLRGERGFASPGEVLLLNRTAAGIVRPLANNPNEAVLNPAGWRIDFAAGAFDVGNTVNDARLSTDSLGLPNGANLPLPDGIGGDSEEANLLFTGASNLITTRSDVFTVYFRVRSFRQNPTTGLWDATDREQIIDESRYVMLVDRSEVNRPGDTPKILYLEKAPK